jgi:tetratricopeptide (TPR) repeat protein
MLSTKEHNKTLAKPTIMADASDTAVKNTLSPNADEESTPLRLPESEELELISKSNDLKTKANSLFTTSSYTEAITGYTRALDTLPTYLDYELAVLKSNISACHVKLAEWKEAIETATDALEGLERLDPSPKVVGAGGEKKLEAEKENADKGDSGVVEEVDDATAERIEALARSGRSVDDVRKLRIKALLRRAKARTELGTWSHLQGAQEGSYSRAHCPQHLQPTYTPPLRLPSPCSHAKSHPHRPKNRTDSSPHPPTEAGGSQAEGNGGYDGQVKTVGQWDVETVRAEYGQLQHGQG